MIYWLTTIKSQIAKKHSNKTRKNNIYCCNKENGKKKSPWVTTMKMIKKSWKGIFLKVHFWQIGTINIFWTGSIFHPKLVLSQFMCNCIKQLAESPWVTKRTTQKPSCVVEEEHRLWEHLLLCPQLANLDQLTSLY